MFAQLLETLFVHKVIVAPIRLSRTRRARRIRYGQLDLGVGLEQFVDEAGLAAARRCTHDEQGAAHSMFCICSRICSISSFSSSAVLVTSMSADLEASVLASRFNSCIRK